MTREPAHARMAPTSSMQAPCPICGKAVPLPEVSQVPADLAFRLLRTATDWHLNMECQEAFTLQFHAGAAKVRR